MKSTDEKDELRPAQNFKEILQPLLKKTASKLNTASSNYLKKNSEDIVLIDQSKKTELDKNIDLITDNWKPLVKIGTTVGIAIVGYKIYKRLTDDGNLSQNNNFEKSRLTGSQIQAKVTALFDAMDRPGTDEIAIMRALEGLTYNEFVQVSDAFGRRSYAISGYSPLPFVSELTLLEWLMKELDTETIQQLKKILPDTF